MPKKFYITTAIAYVNAAPHVGHALEFIGADVIARYHRLIGDDTYFVIGTDEHGIKIKRAAEAENNTPKEHVDKYAAVFKKLKEDLDLSYDYFVRTTDERHKKAVKKIWMAAFKSGDIYKKEYSALYCVGCETFKVHSDLVDGKCPNHDKEPEVVEEENYFFKLSKYAPKILEHLKKNPDFVQPGSKYNEIKSFLEHGVEDISISRPKAKLAWGIEVPNDSDHVMYVWFDALSNYISAIGYEDDQKSFKKWWPCNMHVIGKDISRHHAIIWPGMLMSAGITLPHQVFVHGFITSGGRKMSKHLGNIIDPFAVREKFGIDSLRYLLLRIVPFDDDGDLTSEILTSTYTSDLANDLGNLVSRVTSMCVKYTAGSKKELTSDHQDWQKRVEESWENYHQALLKSLLQKGLDATWKLVRSANAFVDERKPWAQAKEDDKAPLYETLGVLLEVIRHIALQLTPYLPTTAQKIIEQIGEDIDISPNDLSKWGLLKKEGTVKKGDILFPRLNE